MPKSDCVVDATPMPGDETTRAGLLSPAAPASTSDCIPATTDSHDLNRRSLRAVVQMGGTMLVTSLCGMVTGKIIAMVAGAEGVGLVGLYRSLGHLVSLVLALEMTTVIVQRASLAPTPEAARSVFSATWRLFLLQCGIVLLLTLCFSPLIANWMFDSRTAYLHVLEVRLVLLMVIGLLAHRAVVALLEGRALFGRVATVHIGTSVATVAVVYPLLHWGGRNGLALIFGSTCLFGAMFGGFYVVKEYRLTVRDWSPRLTPRRLLQSLPTSGLLTLRTVIYTGALLAFQALLNRAYGLQALGLYNAAALIEGAFLLVLMASMKSYYMPTLGSLAESGEKAAFANTVLSLLLLALLPGTVLLILLAPYLIPLAFTPLFQPAAEILMALSLSLVAQAVSWFYTIFLLHRANYWPHVLLDLGLGVLMLSGAALAIHLQWSLMMVVWLYVLAQCVIAGLYIWIVCSAYGKSMLSQSNRWLGTVTIIATLLAYSFKVTDLRLQGLLAAVVVIVTYLLYRRVFGATECIAPHAAS